MRQCLLDNKVPLRTLHAPLLWGYYEDREAVIPNGFTSARAHARGAHHLPVAQHGDESARPPVRRK